tara:strand:+ start:1189 stop:1557 length:369 start_codon:yes stop_codon:yes gene_type:complete
MLVKNQGMYTTTINGNVLNKGNWDMNYDGETLDLKAKHNDDALFMELNNDEIAQLLQIPASDDLIHNRLENLLSKEEEIYPIILEQEHKKKKTRSSRKKKGSKRVKRKSTKKNRPDYLKTIY